jgi:dihydroneopterin aldolase
MVDWAGAMPDGRRIALSVPRRDKFMSIEEQSEAPRLPQSPQCIASMHRNGGHMESNAAEWGRIAVEVSTTEPATSGRAVRVVIRRLALQACLGVHDWEQATPQPVIVDLEFGVPDIRACRSDDLADTVDYTQVVQCLRTIALEEPHRLAEAMADTMAGRLMAGFRLPWLVLGLTKLAPFPGSEVGVVIERFLDAAPAGRRADPRRSRHDR